MAFLHPEWNRTCEDCIRWLYNADGTQTTRHKEIQTPGGGRRRLVVIQERPRGSELECSKCAKIPEGVFPCPQNAVELSPHNRQALQHYLECRAVNEFPDDPIVRRNASIIRRVTDLADRIALKKILARLAVDGG